MSLLDNFPHLCTIRKRTFSKDSSGGKRSSWTNISTGVECWEQPAGNNEIDSYQKQGMRISHKVYFLTDPGVERNYRILVTSREGTAISSPVELEVKNSALPDSSAGLGVVYKVMCEQITSEND